MRLNKRMIGKIVLIILFLWSWTIFGFNTYNPDYKGYEKGYYSGFSGSASSSYIGNSSEIGFKLLCFFFNAIGVSYQDFLIVMSFVCLGIIAKCMSDYTDSPEFAYVAYLFYPFWMNVIQIRDFIAGVILLYAIRYLMTCNKKNILKYICLIFFATTIHSTSIVYLTLMIIYVENSEKVMKISLLITGALLAVRFFAFGLIGKVINMMSILGSNFTTGTGYLDYSGKYYRLMWIYLLIGGSMVAVYTYKYYTDKKHIRNRALLIGSTGGVKLAWISLIYIPLFSFGSSFGRLYNHMLPILYCVLINGIAVNGRMLNLKRFAVKAYCILVSFILFYAHIITGEFDAYNRIFRNILDNNLFWH